MEKQNENAAKTFYRPDDDSEKVGLSEWRKVLGGLQPKGKA